LSQCSLGYKVFCTIFTRAMQNRSLPHQRPHEPQTALPDTVPPFICDTFARCSENISWRASPRHLLPAYHVKPDPGKNVGSRRLFAPESLSTSTQRTKPSGLSNRPQRPPVPSSLAAAPADHWSPCARLCPPGPMAYMVAIPPRFCGTSQTHARGKSLGSLRISARPLATGLLEHDSMLPTLHGLNDHLIRGRNVLQAASRGA
jgi:hypothetical protein